MTESKGTNPKMAIRKLFSRAQVLAVVLAAAPFAVGCGDGDSSGERNERETATPQEAIVEIAKVRAKLNAADALYAQGHVAKGERLVRYAYLEHFELVEAPLGERDEELNKELEQLISTEIRQEMKAYANPAVVEAQVEKANRELTIAEKALRE